MSLINFPLNELGDVNCSSSRSKLLTHFRSNKYFFYKLSTGLWNSELVFILSKVITS